MGQPVFITFTGADRADLAGGMRALSARYPIEWGILVDPAREGLPLFPDPQVRRAIEGAGLRLCAHVCGPLALDIAEGRDPGLDLSAYARVQVNHSNLGSRPSHVANCHAFGLRRGLGMALQCQGEFPDDARVDWLYDVSFGTGVKPAAWPRVGREHGFCGFSGGLGPDTIAAVLPLLDVAPGASFWIDMESGVRSAGRFDLAKCEAVCRAVYGR